MIVGLGISTEGVKIPLGLWEGSTENATVAGGAAATRNHPRIGEVSVTRSRCLEPARSSRTRQLLVASGKRVCVCQGGGVQHATVGHPQAGPGAQARELRGGATLNRHFPDPQGTERPPSCSSSLPTRAAPTRTSASVIVLAASSSAWARIASAASVCGSVSSRCARRMLASRTVRRATRPAAARGSPDRRRRGTGHGCV